MAASRVPGGLLENAFNKIIILFLCVERLIQLMFFSRMRYQVVGFSTIQVSLLNVFVLLLFRNKRFVHHVRYENDFGLLKPLHYVCGEMARMFRCQLYLCRA